MLKKPVLRRSPTPYLTSVFCFCFLLFLVFFQSTTIDCKLTSAAAGDKNFDKSPTKTRQPRKVDLRARYWAFLFDNLRRAVDEIYVTCESDQSVVECKVSLQLFFACCHVALTVVYYTLQKSQMWIWILKLQKLEKKCELELEKELDLQKHVTFWFVFSEG